MNVTLFHNDLFQTVSIKNNNDLHQLIELYFDIPPSYQIIKLNDKIITPQCKIVDGDLLYIYTREKVSYSHINILVECNNHTFKVIIDSGAQSCIISEHLATMLQLSIDRKMKGQARGIGNAKIVGGTRCTLKIQNQYYDLDFSVMETDVHDLNTKYLVLIGLDFLFPNQCEISFKNKTILIQNTLVPLMNEYALGQYLHPIKNVCAIEQHYKKLDLSLDEHSMLKKILNNIILHPSEEKYKLINTNGVTYQKYLSKCTALMKELGFVEVDKQLKYTNDINTLSNLIEIM